MSGARPDLVLIGQTTVDHVVPARPGPWAPRIGGNVLYAAAGARLWLDPGRIGVVTRVGRGFPLPLEPVLDAAGIGHRALRPAPVDHLAEWFLYEEDGSRLCIPRNPELRAGSENQGTDRGAYLRRLEELSPTADDVPSAWLPAAAVHLSPQVAVRHRAAVAVFRDRSGFLSVDPSPHYSLGLAPPALRDLLDGATAILPSEQEVRHLLDRKPAVDVARDLAVAGFPEVVLKLGARGAVVAEPGRAPVALPAAPAAPVDPTGAGDSFCGAYAASRLLGLEPVDAARRAAIAAAMVVQSAGAEAALTLDPAEAIDD